MAQVIDQTDPRWILIPDSTSTMWQDTATLDAGTAMILINNYNHIKEESCKHLLSISCAGYYPSQDHPDGYYGITDITQPDLATAPDEYQISWNGRTGKRFGPFYIPVDGIGTNGAGGLSPGYIRNVIVKLQIYNNSGTVNGYCYLTASPSPPTDGYLAKSIFTETASGLIQRHCLLKTSEPTTPNARRVTDFASYSVRVYLWVGVKFSVSNSDVLSISAFEAREEL